MTTITTVSGHERTNYSTKETAQFIREALKQTFPGVKFSVRTSYASMTSSTHVRWTDGPTEPEVELVTGRFTSRGFDGMTDSTTYHEQIVDGKHVSYSGWITTRREISTALWQKAIDRYNAQRAEYGAPKSDITVVESAWGPKLEGGDLNKPNPCGGPATWGSDAVYQIVHVMRANGVIVHVKS